MDELSPTDSGYGRTIGIGSNDITQAADNSGNVSALSIDPNRYSTETMTNRDFLTLNEPVGNTSPNYTMPSAYSSDGLLNTVKKLFTDKDGNINMQALGALGGGLAGLLGAMDKTTTPTGYQGGIPNLSASRSMITAPPTEINGVKRRPGQGGINYGGDVTYSRVPSGTDPWANLSGTSGSLPSGSGSPGPNLSGILGGLGGIAGALTAGASPTTVTPTTVTPASTTSAVTNQQILDWLKANPGASDITIGNAMEKYGVTPAQMAAATGLTVGEVQNRFNMSNTIEDLLAKNEGASDTVLRALMEQNKITPEQMALASGVSLEDVLRRYNAVPSSGQSSSGQAANTDMYDKDFLSTYLPEFNPDEYFFAGGGMAKGRYLQGGTDGMADRIPAQIGQDQPAALSHGEFVIPADVVSHMGNGNSDAGAKKLYQMMDKIRMARTGSKKQGRKINPDKFMPGGLASAYAGGGQVKHYLEGGGVSGLGSAANAGVTGTESSLSNWSGPYVTNMLGQGQALANMPYQAYTGPLTAGETPLQTQAFQTAGNLTTPASIGQAATTAGNIANKAQGLSYTPTTTSFDATQAQAYMNPYLQASLNPQLEEARRQSQITQQQNAAKMTQAGAFGGSRQAILDAETQRSLGTNLANITGTGYNTAYNNAQAQFNADQQRKMAENQYGAGYGLQGLQAGLQAAQAQGVLGGQENQIGLANLSQQLAAGQQQRGIESEGIAADKAQFEEARANPYKMVQFQQSLLQGLPTNAQNINVAQPSTLQQILAGAGGVAGLFPTAGTTGSQDLAAALKRLGIG
jgi:hypothetical protein